MTAIYNNYQKNKSKLTKFIYRLTFLAFMTYTLLLSGCGFGSNNSASSINNTTPDIIMPAIESILLVSPTKSGEINSIIGYPQKILVAGIDKNGSRKLLGPSDGLTFKLNDQKYGSVDKFGILSGNTSGQTSLIINLNNRFSITVPVKIQKITLNAVTVIANNSKLSTITIPQNYHIPIKAEGTFYNDKNYTQQIIDISNYVGLWSSNNTNIALESDCITGVNLFPGNSLGTTQISAKLGVPENSILVNVINAPLTSIKIVPNSNDIPINSNINMTAIGTFRGTSIDLDITNNLAWKIESTVLATINRTTGMLTTHESVGKIVVIAKAPSGESSTSSLTISDTVFKYVFIKSQSNGNPTESITIHKGESKIIYPYTEYYNGKTESINVNDPKNDCKWIIENENQHIINFNNDGTKAILQGKLLGDTAVTLSCKDNTLQYKTYIHVAAAIPTKLIIESDGAPGPTGKIRLPIGAHEKLHGVVYYSDGESSIVHPGWWSIQNNNIASIESSSGTLTGKSIGNTLIKTAVNIDGYEKFADESIEVNAATLQKIIIQGESTVVSGTSKTFKAIGVYSDGNELDISETVNWSCELPIKSCHQGLVIADSNIKESQFAQIAVTDRITNINSESSINIVPVAMIALIFNENPAYSKCTNLGSSAVCYIKFKAEYNDGSRKDYSDFGDCQSSFQISPKYSSCEAPSNKQTNQRPILTIGYTYRPLPASVEIIANSRGFTAKHTFKVIIPPPKD